MMHGLLICNGQHRFSAASPDNSSREWRVREYAACTGVLTPSPQRSRSEQLISHATWFLNACQANTGEWNHVGLTNIQRHAVYMKVVWLTWDWARTGWAKCMELACRFLPNILFRFAFCFMFSILSSVRFAALNTTFTPSHAALAISSSQIILVRYFAALQSSFAPSPCNRGGWGWDYHPSVLDTPFKPGRTVALFIPEYVCLPAAAHTWLYPDSYDTPDRRCLYQPEYQGGTESNTKVGVTFLLTDIQ